MSADNNVIVSSDQEMDTGFSDARMLRQSQPSRDRRYLKTEKKLIDNLLELMQNKPLASISVTELVRRSGINRATFYQHYNGIQDLYLSIEDRLLEHFDLHIKDVITRLNVPVRFGDLRQLRDFDFCGDIFHYLRLNAAILKVVLESNDSHLLSRLYRHSLKVFIPLTELIDPGGSSTAAELYFSFVVNGMIGMARTWIDQGCRSELNKIRDLANDFIFNCLCQCIRHLNAGRNHDNLRKNP